MLTQIRSARRGVAVLMLALAAFTSPLFAESVEECYDDVITLCDDTLEDSNWLEKIAVGAACSLMLAGCTLESVSLSFH